MVQGGFFKTTYFALCHKIMFCTEKSISLQEMTPEKVRNRCFVGHEFQEKWYGNDFL